MAALKQTDFNAFSGIVEMDETYFLYSEKGKRNIKERKPRKRGVSSRFRGISREQVCVLIAKARQKATYSGVLGRWRLVKTQLDTAIGSKLSPDNTLCTDAWRAFSTYAKSKGMEHYRFKSDGIERVRGIYHIQNVNNYHSRLKGWIQRFNGVATKYLDHFLSWFQFLDIVKHKSDEGSISKMIVETCLLPINETYNSLKTYRY
ncbi:transposase-like protein [Sporosarcina sp. JAI121]|nr:transposase-like protein [Sporosarcina sp. JAI121]